MLFVCIERFRPNIRSYIPFGVITQTLSQLTTADMSSSPFLIRSKPFKCYEIVTVDFGDRAPSLRYRRKMYVTEAGNSVR